MTVLVSTIPAMEVSADRRVLVVGMGVSGIATAARLAKAGWTPVIVERSAERRRGGYFVALFGAGRIAAERLGMLDHLYDRSSTDAGVALSRDGVKKPSMTYGNLPGNPWLMLRGDVEAAAFATLPPHLEIRYSTVPIAISQDDSGATVTLHNTADDTTVTERFSLVVGCDGLRSTVRNLVFGPHELFLKRLNYMVVAYQYPGRTLRGLAAGESAILHEPGRSMWVFAFKDHDPTVLLTYRTDDVDAEFAESVAQRVRAAYGPDALGETLGDAIDALDKADGVLFDSAEQVDLKAWHERRVVLVGDAAWCTTLYAGMGVSAGLAGADLLGAMLERHHDDIEAALNEWETALRPYIASYQRKGRNQRSLFVQANRTEMIVQKLLMKLVTNRYTQRLFKPLQPNSGSATSADIVGTVMASRPDHEPTRAI
jgi:2-polyprenyl-6-methoxyphenol hydroxylase-like FAD-dependent oxidoreductase